jgi:hypothetical protein
LIKCKTWRLCSVWRWYRACKAESSWSRWKCVKCCKRTGRGSRFMLWIDSFFPRRRQMALLMRSEWNVHLWIRRCSCIVSSSGSSGVCDFHYGRGLFSFLRATFPVLAHNKLFFAFFFSLSEPPVLPRVFSRVPSLS